MSVMPSLLDLLRVVQDPSTWNVVTHVQGGSSHFSYLTNPSLLDKAVDLPSR